MTNRHKNKTKSELIDQVSFLEKKVKRLQKKLSEFESDTEYHKIASTVIDGLFFYSKTGFIYVNDTLAVMLGYTVDELVKKDIKDLVAENDRELVMKRAKERLAGRKVPRDYDVYLIHKNGQKLIPVTFNLSLLKINNNPVILGIVKDNSEKTRVEKELHEFEAKFNAITNSAADGIIIVTEEFNITYWNNAAEKMFGYSIKETLNKNFLNLICPPDRIEPIQNNLMLSHFNKDSEESAGIFEIELLERSGQLVPVEISTAVVLSDDYHHLILILRDITDRVEKNKQIAEEWNLTQYFMDYIPFSIYFKDISSRFIKVNKSTVQKLGFKSSDELIGKTDHDIFTKEHADVARNDELKLISQQEKIINKVERETWKEGKISWVSTTKAPLRDHLGNIIGTFGITRDITQIKKSQLIQKMLLKISSAVNTVEAIEELYLEIHQAVKELMKADNFYIALYDEESKILSFPYFVDEYDEKPKPRIAGRGLTEYVIRSGKPQLIDSELDLALRKLGETDLIGEASIIWLGVPLNIGEQTIGAVVVQDYKDPLTYGEEELQILTYVSEQIASAISKKNSEQQLKKFSEELQETNAAKDKFFSIIAHDLKSPFQGLIGLSRLIVEEYNELSEEELKSFVQALNESAESTYGLIENLLEWSRLQTGKVKFNPSSIDIFIVIEEIKMLLYQTAELKKIKITNKVPPNTLVWGDKYMLSSLFQNLISNSIKFTNRFGEITIDADQQKNKLKVSLSDNGVGIDYEDIDKIFRIDATFSTRGTDQEKGTGLGLILCKEIVNRHGGEITIESEKEKGTKVIFTLRTTGDN
jgi:PAS domain S-box-containing protein